jgi:hypothetical protein
MSYDSDLLEQFDLTTGVGKAAYQRHMTLEHLDGFILSLDTTINEFRSGDIDDEDLIDTVELLSEKIREAFVLVRKYHD